MLLSWVGAVMWLLLGVALVGIGGMVAMLCADPEAERQVRKMNEVSGEKGDPWLPRLPENPQG